MAHPIVRKPRRRTPVQPPGRGLRAASISTGHSAYLPLRAHPLHLRSAPSPMRGLTALPSDTARRQVRAATHPPVPPGGSRGGRPPVPLPPPGCARRAAAAPPLRLGIGLAPRRADVIPVRLARGRSTALGSARVTQAPHSRRDEAGTPAGGVARGEADAIGSRLCGSASRRRGPPRRPASARRRVERRASHRPAARRPTPPDAMRTAGRGEHGGRRSRARRHVDAAPQQWHTVRGHRLSQKSELPGKPRCQAWHAPGGLDWRPSARPAGTAWREDRAALRAGRWARTGRRSRLVPSAPADTASRHTPEN